MTAPLIADLADRLDAAGFVAAQEEAGALVAAADGDEEVVETLVKRRLTGEPLAWITGSVPFAGTTLQVDPGVYVPRWHTEELAQIALERLPADGVAIDLCTGTGAIAAFLRSQRPEARILATDLSEVAVACARSNEVDALLGDLFEPVPIDLGGHVDLVVGVVPYVPTEALGLLQRDTLAFEPAASYDGGPGGVALLRRAIEGAATMLRPGGALVLELGGDQAAELEADLADLGFVDVIVHVDEEGDARAIEATLDGGPGKPVGKAPVAS